MCFKNLPVEFDENGVAYLKEGVNNPYDYQVIDLSEREDKVHELLASNGFIKSIDYDPVTRVAGALAFHSVVDLKERKVLSTNSMATFFAILSLKFTLWGTVSHFKLTDRVLHQ